MVVPDWCFNQLTVRPAAVSSGSVAQLPQFDVWRLRRELHSDPALVHHSASQNVVEALRPQDDAPVLSFERALPTPEDLDEIEHRLRWRVDHWGSKWDAQETKIVRFADDVLVYRFETAYTPPVSWLRAVSGEHPECEFELVYVGEGKSYAGVIVADSSGVKDATFDSESIDAQLFIHGSGDLLQGREEGEECADGE